MKKKNLHLTSKKTNPLRESSSCILVSAHLLPNPIQKCDQTHVTLLFTIKTFLVREPLTPRIREDASSGHVTVIEDACSELNRGFEVGCIAPQIEKRCTRHKG
jgi:hypothetical protein